MLRVIIVFAAVITAFNAAASSEAAWAKGDKAMQAACLKASGLKAAKAAGAIIHYDDEVGYSALLIGGRYPQPFMKNKQGKELCLYQRATQKAVVQEADGFLGKP
ncbi:hypothetical protein AWY96_12360 [Serratia plymuthica]|uniref:hypothetical protein n=1 Tax=Serratia plymuthica TaxID=82996 RepID=UPI00079FFDA7|nr:hypothetical protein [Serratia plymuthica]KYQ99250.1 hypothetical protein AWY96_12360 [Serratia plymuthica]